MLRVYLRRYILSISGIHVTIIITTIISSRKGTPIKRMPLIQRGHGWEKVHFSTLFNSQTSHIIYTKICCNRKSPYFEVSTGCGLKFPSESIDDCFSIILDIIWLHVVWIAKLPQLHSGKAVPVWKVLVHISGEENGGPKEINIPLQRSKRSTWAL